MGPLVSTNQRLSTPVCRQSGAWGKTAHDLVMVEGIVVGFPESLDFEGQTGLLADRQMNRCRPHGFDKKTFARDPGIAQLTAMQDLVPACSAGTDKPHGPTFRDTKIRGVEIDIHQFSGIPINDKGMLVARASVELLGESDLLFDFGHEFHRGLVVSGSVTG